MVGFKGQLIPEIKAFSEDGTFEGILSTYGNLDLVGDICEAGCFEKSLTEGGTRRKLLRDHDWGKIIGYFDVTDSTDSLAIKGHICTNTQVGRDTYELMKFGALDGLSIGYYATRYRYDEEGVRHLVELDLREGSVVGDPANPMATIQAVKSRRLAKMSRYAKCSFLKKLSDEDRDAALAELDALDSEEEGAESEGTKEPDEKADDEIPEEKPEDAKSEDQKPEGDEKESEGGEDDEEVAEGLKKAREALEGIRRQMEV